MYYKKKGNLGNFLYRCVVYQRIQRFPFGSPCFFCKRELFAKVVVYQRIQRFPFGSPFYKKSPKNTIFEHFLLYLASFWYYLRQVKMSHFRFVSFWYYLCSMTHLKEPKGNHFYVQHELYHTFIFFFGGYTPKPQWNSCTKKVTIARYFLCTWILCITYA